VSPATATTADLSKNHRITPFCSRNKRFSLNPNPGLPQGLILPGLKSSTASLCLHTGGGDSIDYFRLTIYSVKQTPDSVRTGSSTSRLRVEILRCAPPFAKATEGRQDRPCAGMTNGRFEEVLRPLVFPYLLKFEKQMKRTITSNTQIRHFQHPQTSLRVPPKFH